MAAEIAFKNIYDRTLTKSQLNISILERMQKNSTLIQSESDINLNQKSAIVAANEAAYSVRGLIMKTLIYTHDTIDLITTVYPSHETNDGIIATFKVNGHIKYKSYYGDLFNDF